jgi:hypothetical protein
MGMRRGICGRCDTGGGLDDTHPLLPVNGVVCTYYVNIRACSSRSGREATIVKRRRASRPCIKKNAAM